MRGASPRDPKTVIFYLGIFLFVTLFLGDLEGSGCVILRDLMVELRDFGEILLGFLREEEGDEQGPVPRALGFLHLDGGGMFS